MKKKSEPQLGSALHRAQRLGLILKFKLNKNQHWFYSSDGYVRAIAGHHIKEVEAMLTRLEKEVFIALGKP